MEYKPNLNLIYVSYIPSTHSPKVILHSIFNVPAWILTQHMRLGVEFLIVVPHWHLKVLDFGAVEVFELVMLNL
jgi:hypothetical protein